MKLESVVEIKKFAKTIVIGLLLLTGMSDCSAGDQYSRSREGLRVLASSCFLLKERLNIDMSKSEYFPCSIQTDSRILPGHYYCWIDNQGFQRVTVNKPLDKRPCRLIAVTKTALSCNKKSYIEEPASKDVDSGINPRDLDAKIAERKRMIALKNQQGAKKDNKSC